MPDDLQTLSADVYPPHQVFATKQGHSAQRDYYMMMVIKTFKIIEASIQVRERERDIPVFPFLCNLIGSPCHRARVIINTIKHKKNNWNLIRFTSNCICPLLLSIRKKYTSGRIQGFIFTPFIFYVIFDTCCMTFLPSQSKFLRIKAISVNVYQPEQPLSTCCSFKTINNTKQANKETYFLQFWGTQRSLMHIMTRVSTG